MVGHWVGVVSIFHWQRESWSRGIWSIAISKIISYWKRCRQKPSSELYDLKKVNKQKEQNKDDSWISRQRMVYSTYAMYFKSYPHIVFILVISDFSHVNNSKFLTLSLRLVWSPETWRIKSIRKDSEVPFMLWEASITFGNV